MSTTFACEMCCGSSQRIIYARLRSELSGYDDHVHGADGRNSKQVQYMFFSNLDDGERSHVITNLILQLRLYIFIFLVEERKIRVQ